MDQGGCPLNGGGGGGPDSGPGPGMITLEDLESFDEDPQMDSGHGSLEDEAETTGEEQQGRLLNYWQVAARGHQVQVSPDMAQPIQQLTTNNHGRSEREQVPFSLIARKEKCGDVLYEKRSYEKANWACITVREDTYEQSICYGFMRIMKYICEQNSLGEYLGMSLPIVTVVRTDESQSVISRDVTVGYYLPVNHQAQPPQPFDTDIVIEVWPAVVVYTRTFGGPTNEVTIVDQIRAMTEVLDARDLCVNNSFIIAGYTNPAHINRRNEIWFLER